MLIHVKTSPLQNCLILPEDFPMSFIDDKNRLMKQYLVPDSFLEDRPSRRTPDNCHLLRMELLHLGMSRLVLESFVFNVRTWRSEHIRLVMIELRHNPASVPYQTNVQRWRFGRFSWKKPLVGIEYDVMILNNPLHSLIYYENYSEPMYIQEISSLKSFVTFNDQLIYAVNILEMFFHRMIYVVFFFKWQI